MTNQPDNRCSCIASFASLSSFWQFWVGGSFFGVCFRQIDTRSFGDLLDERAFPAPGQARPGVEVLTDLLSRFDGDWNDQLTAAEVFDRLAGELGPFAGLSFARLPPQGVRLEVTPSGAR